MPVMVRAREPVQEEGKMAVIKGDIILIIEGRSENYWWKGTAREQQT